MKNIYLYYLTITTPLLVIVWLSAFEIIETTSFLALFCFYLFVFRTYVDGKRLAEKNIIDHRDIWKMIIPGKHITYFRALYLK